MKTLLLLSFSLMISSAFSQTPGGTFQPVLIWIKANTGTIPATGVGTLTTWNNNGTAGAITINGSPTFEENGFNYNPKIHFNGDGNFLAHNGIIFGSIYAVVELEDLSRQYTHLSTWTNMCSGPHVDGTLHGGTNGANAAYHLSPYSPEFESPGAWKKNGLDVAHTNLYTVQNELISAVANSGDLDTYGDRLLGGQACLPSRDWLGDASEVIILSGTSTAAERNQIESYLAVKYGITLGNFGGGNQGDYVSTTGTNIWDASINPVYHNDVIGIGRDDAEVLRQVQSHTEDDTTRIYLGTLSATNAGNLSNFSDNMSYILAGHNQGAMNSTVASNAEIPVGLFNCNLYSRLEREWKIQRTGTVTNFNMDFTLSNNAFPGSVNLADLRLLIDDDGDFSNGGTTCYYNGDGTGIAISYSAPVITVSNITTLHIPDNAIRYATIASIQSITPLPVSLTDVLISCEENHIRLNWLTSSEVNNDYFSVERGRSDDDFEVVATIDGAGNSSTNESYQWIDHSPLSGVSYYRLSQTDFDGMTEYFAIKSVQCNGNGTVSLHPNPFENHLVIRTSYSGVLSIVDQAGKVVLEKGVTAGKNTIQTDFSSGVYMAYFNLDNGNRQIRKIVKF